MMYNTCAVCGNAFLAEGQGPAYRRCANDRDYTPTRAAVKSRTTLHADGGLAGAPLAAPSSSPKSLVCAECGIVIPDYSIKPLCVIHLQALKEKEAVA